MQNVKYKADFFLYGMYKVKIRKASGQERFVDGLLKPKGKGV
jgi:hypothetical protein